ncbi:hypothetical protein AALJ34_16790 [Paraclostridium bifermentans]|uniref:hypothetical protein n=1 Tax=Paraclostridium bifermentans TaxID=1490 RepID=UPI001C125655|nr:hypothetical protein [Paraclostridium bifermentans]MBU5288287.1 hypothetical protein [Paraclostridium bifermentans]
MDRFENGFHSFKKAIIGLTKNSSNEFDLKDIIINFHHSIEVLFKYILHDKNNLYIYKDIDKLIERNLKMKFGIIGKNNCELFTINFNDTINRVIAVCEVEIDKYTYNRINNLNKFRNSLTHDELVLIKEEVDQLVISVLPTVIMILRKYLPKENEKEFIEFIDDEEIAEGLNNLYTDNEDWKIITIINLLTAYKSIEYDRISKIDKNHINKMLFLLGCEINEYDIITSVDGSSYSSTFSYLKQEICNEIVFYSKRIKEYKNNDKMKELLDKNEVIADICKESILNMSYHLIELMNIDIQNLSGLINDEKNVNSFFENKSLINKLDIYETLFYIEKTAQSYIEIFDQKKKIDSLFKEILLYKGKDSICVYSIYNCLINWFKRARWYNITNFKYISKEAMNVLVEDDFLHNEIDDEVKYKMYDDDFFSDLIGEFGEWSSIDYIDTWDIEGINTIIEDSNDSKYYTLILDVSVAVQAYIDHAYCDNGTEQTYVAVRGRINKSNKFDIDNIDYIGCKMCVKGFGFK